MSTEKVLSNVEKHTIKQMIKKLQKASGSGTSMVTLIIKAGDQLSRHSKLLTDELGTAANIKSRVNRLSVLSAITAAKYRLGQYSRIPANGLAIFCGTGVTDEGKEKKISLAFEPPLPLSSGAYTCDSRFHTELLHGLLEDNQRYGFIIVDGSGTLYGAISGNSKEVLNRFNVDLPKKHKKGGQSSVRFARLRVEAINNYIRKVCELANRTFLKDNRVTVTGLILAGSANMKDLVDKSEILDKRIKEKIISRVDISYGGDNGFNQAISASAELMSDLRLVEEKLVITKLFDEINQDTGKYCFGIVDTMHALEMGAVEMLLVWENVVLNRYVHCSKTDKSHTEVVFAAKPGEIEGTELVEVQPFDEWITENYKKFGTRLEFVSDNSSEGTQFCRGFGGIGGTLRWAIDFSMLHEDDDYDDDDDDSGDEFW